MSTARRIQFGAQSPQRVRLAYSSTVERWNSTSSGNWLLLLLGICLLVSGSVGCTSLEMAAQLPSKNILAVPQLQVYSDFAIPPNHRLWSQLTERKASLEAALGIPLADEPIHVYLFADEASFSKYARQQLPGFVGRRALFVKSDTRLMVLAHWHDQLGEDLRHELVHGYLHATLPWLPLWLDEGLAEYFEAPSQADSRQARHIAHLASEFRAGRWQPSLERLEAFEDAARFGETQYAESWLWVHFLLTTTPDRSAELQQYVRSLQAAQSPNPQLSEQLGTIRTAWELELLTHLKHLAGELLAGTSGGQMASE